MMIAITVDDERPMLKALTDIVKSSSDIEAVYDFYSCSAALEWISQNTADVAFLDINMRGMGGLALAERINEIWPECKIVFCTGYEEFAYEAIQLRCSGYLMKPVTKEAIQKEIDYIKIAKQDIPLIDVKCFGTFEVLKNGKALTFSRTRAKELLAILVDRNGAGISGKQICAIMWSENTNDAKNMDYLRHLVGELKKALARVGAEQVLCQEGYNYRVDPAKINCDYHNFLKSGTPQFHGEYMSQYSWAENTLGLLLERKI